MLCPPSPGWSSALPTLCPPILTPPTPADPSPLRPTRPPPPRRAAAPPFIHSFRQLCGRPRRSPAAQRRSVPSPRGPPLRPGLTAGPLPALSSAAASWGVSCRIRERNPGLVRSLPPARPSAPQRPRPPGGLSSRGRAPGLGCSRHGRGAAPGRRQAEPLVGDSRGAQQFRVSAGGRRSLERPGRGGRGAEARRAAGERVP